MSNEQKVYVSTETKPNPEAKKIITRRANGSVDVGTVLEGKSLTQQQFKDDCDVNLIVAKYERTGTVTHVRNAQTGVYADLSNLPDVHEARNTIIQAENAFNAMPAQIRNRFNNDPAELIKFIADPRNTDEAIKLGLRTVTEKPIIDPVLNELKTVNKNLAKNKPKTKPPENTDD